MGKIHDLYRNYLSIEDGSVQKKIAKKEFYDGLTADNVNEPDDDERSLFHLAAGTSDIELLDCLIKLRAKLPSREDYPITPLKVALLTRNPDRVYIISKLIKYCDYVNFIHMRQEGLSVDKGDTKEEPPFSYIDEIDEFGETILSHETSKGNLENIEILTDNGADLMTINRYSKTAYTEALLLEKNRDEILKILFSKHVGLCIIDFAKLLPPPNVTDNALVMYGIIYAGDNSCFITRKTPGFEKAITNIEEFNEAIKKGMTFDYEKIYLSLKKRIECTYQDHEIEHIARQKLIEFASEVKRLWQKSISITKVRDLCIFYLADHLSIYQKLKTQKSLPEEMEVEILQLAKELEIKKPAT